MTKKNKSNKRANGRGSGWHDDPYRHALASMGVPTAHLSEMQAKGILFKTDKEKEAKRLKKEAKHHSKMARQHEKISKEEDKLELDKKKKELEEIKEDRKSLGTDWVSKLKTSASKLGQYAKKAGEWGVDKYRELAEGEEDEAIGSILADDIKQNVTRAIHHQEGRDYDRKTPDYTEEDLRDILESGTPAELYKAIRRGQVIDANAIAISDKNKQKLVKHIADLKHDAELAKEMYDRFRDKESEMRRYYRTQHEVYADELRDEWRATEDMLEGTEREKELNEFKHLREMHKVDMQNKISEFVANLEYAKVMSQALGEVYDNQQKFVAKLIK